MPAQESLVHGSRLMVQPGARSLAPLHRAPVRTLPSSGGESSPIPQFLKR
jgi:hypothetical protein